MTATTTLTDLNAKRDVLKSIFDKVCDPQDWKDEVCAWINHNDFAIVNEAVQFFTATSIEVIGGPQQITGRILVYAKGYRRGPAC